MRNDFTLIGFMHFWFGNSNTAETIFISEWTIAGESEETTIMVITPLLFYKIYLYILLTHAIFGNFKLPTFILLK